MNEEMLEDGGKFFGIAILLPGLHAIYSKQFLYYNQCCCRRGMSSPFKF